VASEPLREVSDLVPDGQVVPKHPVALFLDGADAGADAFIELVEHALIVVGRLRIAAHIDDGTHVDEAVEGRHGRGPVLGTIQDLEPQLAGSSGVPHDLHEASLREGATRDLLGHRNHLLELALHVGDLVVLGFAVEERRFVQQSRRSGRGKRPAGVLPESMAPMSVRP
jgi:hypothetical protein